MCDKHVQQKSVVAIALSRLSWNGPCMFNTTGKIVQNQMQKHQICKKRAMRIDDNNAEAPRAQTRHRKHELQSREANGPSKDAKSTTSAKNALRCKVIEHMCQSFKHSTCLSDQLHEVPKPSSPKMGVNTQWSQKATSHQHASQFITRESLPDIKNTICIQTFSWVRP